MPEKIPHLIKDVKALSNLSVALILLNETGIFYFNDSAKKLFRVKKLDKSLDFSELNFLSKKETTKLLMSDTLSSAIKLNCKTLSNKIIFIEAIIEVVNYNGEKAIQAIIRPISEHDNLLFETKQKFDLITNNGHDIIVFHTFYPKEKYLYVSPNIKRILGYEPQELYNNNKFFTDLIKEDKEKFIKNDKLLKSYQRNQIHKNEIIQFPFNKKNGEKIWIENSYMPIKNAQNKTEFFLYIFRDITQQKLYEIELKTQYDNYKNLLDSSPAAYVIHHHGVCLYVNKALLDLFKLKTKTQILGKFILDFLNDTDRKKAVERLKDTYSTNSIENLASTYNAVDVHGNKVLVEIKSILIKFNDKDCILSLVTNLSEQQRLEREKQFAIVTASDNKLLQREIKVRQSVEQNLMAKTAQLTAILENSTHLIWTVNRSFQITSFNKNFQRVVKENHNININHGMVIDEFINKNSKEEYTNFWYPKYEQAFTGVKQEFEKEEIRNRKVFRKIFINPIYNHENQIVEISCIAHDITDSKTYEQKLLSQSGKLTAIFDSSHHYIWTIDKEQQLTSFNKNYYDLVTALYNTKPYVGLKLDRGVLSNDFLYNQTLQAKYEIAFRGKATSFEVETLDKDNKRVYLEIFLNPIYENDVVVEVSGIAHNVTEKRIVQQRMELSLKEKEVLLREVHHRVKNNMQVISSILNLQSSYVSDEYALMLLKESQNRIKTMAYIHENLYQNKSFTSVNFSDYVRTLVNNIVQSYTYSDEKIKLVLGIENITLSLDGSIPAGLIINELITNAIKHAFPGKKQGEIFFNLLTQNNFVILEIKDNGVGFADGVDFEKTQSLGLQLVNTLIEQIEGKLTFKTEKNIGTEITVTFKM